MGLECGPQVPFACFLSATGTGGARCISLLVWLLTCSVPLQHHSSKIMYAALQTIDATKEHSQQAFIQASSYAALAMCCNACS